MKNYSDRHAMVRRIRGSSREYTCVGNCGRAAFHWATIHGRNGQDPDDYQPMCVRCHFEYDSEAHRAPDVRERQGAAHRGKPKPPEQREKMSAAQRGKPKPSSRYPRSDETRAKMSAWGLANREIKAAAGRKSWESRRASANPHP